MAEAAVADDLGGLPRGGVDPFEEYPDLGGRLVGIVVGEQVLVVEVDGARDTAGPLGAVVEVPSNCRTA